MASYSYRDTRTHLKTLGIFLTLSTRYDIKLTKLMIQLLPSLSHSPAEKLPSAAGFLQTHPRRENASYLKSDLTSSSSSFDGVLFCQAERWSWTANSERPNETGMRGRLHKSLKEYHLRWFCCFYRDICRFLHWLIAEMAEANIFLVYHRRLRRNGFRQKPHSCLNMLRKVTNCKFPQSQSVCSLHEKRRHWNYWKTQNVKRSSGIIPMT